MIDLENCERLRTPLTIKPLLAYSCHLLSVMFTFHLCCYVAGFKVITFKNPYLGNTCVPFQHWACSLACAQAIEIPARLEQIAAARQLDKQYDAYIKDCQKTSHGQFPKTPREPQPMAGQAQASQPMEVQGRHARQRTRRDSGSQSCYCVIT